MLNTSINVKTDLFDGPLALLLLLIKKEEMSLKDFDLRIITKQYLEYINHFKELNFDLAGDFLFMAATLIYLKSKDCLAIPITEELANELGILSTEELIRRLEQLERFQKLGLKLGLLPKLGTDYFSNIQKIDKNILKSDDLNITQLANAFTDVLSRQNRSFGILKKETVSIKNKLQQLKEFLTIDMQTTLDEICSLDAPNTSNKIVSFIAILELARLQKIEVFQNENFAPIHLKVLSLIAETDMGLILEENSWAN